MKATLEFNLPEEAAEHELALRGSEFFCALEEIKRALRAARKYESYGEVTKNMDALISDLESHLPDVSRIP